MDDLKPCPFCGGKAALRMFWMEDGHRYRAVECVECGATTPGNYSEVGDQSAWDWNARTPEQAIAATLGCGTCEIYRVSNTQDLRKCSACGVLMHFDHPLDRSHLNYCPNCGAKVEQ